LKVVVVGDSIGDNLGSGLRAWAKDRSDVAVYNLAIPACPFSRGPARRIGEDQPFPVDEACAWWADPESDRRKAFEKYDPDIVVTQDGINNVFERWLPAWDEWRAPGHPGYDQWEVDEYNTVFDLWRSGGAQILVTNTPCGDWQRTFDKVKDPEQKVRAMNFTYNRLANIAQADLFERLCPGGQYRDDVEGMPDSRHDGFHMTPEASAALARNWLGPIVLDTAANHRTGRVG
jgi:hypothetical protein